MKLVVKNPPANAGDIRDMGTIPGLGRSPGGAHGNPLQYSCLKKPMDREAWWVIVHGVAELDMTECLTCAQTKAGNQCSQVVTAYIYCPEAIINTIRINGLVSAKKGGHHKLGPRW